MSCVNVTFPTSQTAAQTGRRVAVSTLGCKVNLYESNLIAQNLSADNWQSVGTKEKADMYVINTCTVTQEADRQARQQVRRLIRQNPDALIVVTGCYAQMDPTACADIPGVDLVIGNDQKLDLHQLLPLYENGELPKVVVGELDQHVSLPDGLLAGFEGQTRAFMQIQQGCDQGCTFCIIHRARGPSRSIPITVLKRQAHRLVVNGYQELVICGVDLGSYGEDFDHDNYSLVTLIDELHAEYPQVRLRLSSIDPVHISDELIERFAQRKVCPHLHLSLQSASTLILKRMKRRYDRDLVYERISKLRSAVPDLVISADVMTGFPTETEDQFEQTLHAISDLEIAYPHVFPYSQRGGTPAARIPRQVPVKQRKLRAARVRKLGQQILTRVLTKNIGKTVTVLTEESIDKKTGLRKARADNYLPSLMAAEIEANQLIEVVNNRIQNNSLIAQSSLKTVN